MKRYLFAIIAILVSLLFLENRLHATNKKEYIEHIATLKRNHTLDMEYVKLQCKILIQECNK
jgi:hypothetical protein